MIKAVLFDVDGVLIDSFEANLKFFNDLLPKFGYALFKKEEYKKISHESTINVIRIATQSKSTEEIEKIYKFGMSPEVEYDMSLITIRADIENILNLLSYKYIIGIVSSREKEFVFEFPPLANLKEYFKVVVAFEDTQNHKPNPEPLILASQKLLISLEECVYVGDTESDMIAAKAAGMKSVLYSKDQSFNADTNIFVFKELPKIIESL